MKASFLRPFCFIRFKFNAQVWNRPYANTAVNQAVNVLTRDNRCNNPYNLPQPTSTSAANFQSNLPGPNQEQFAHCDDSNLSYPNRNSCVNPIAMAEQRSYGPLNGQLQAQSYSIPQTLHDMPPQPTFLPHDTATNGPSIFDGSVNSYSNINVQQPSDMNHTDSSSPIPNSETFVEVLPSEITCPACILQVK